MAVIDELIVKLGLDTKDFKRGSASATRDLDKTKKEANKVANDIRHSGKDAAKFFGEMAISAAQFFSVLGGATSLTAFARQMTNAQASLGLFSQNISNNSRDLVAWQNAVGAFGGTADGLNGTLQKLSTAQQNYKLGIADPDMIARLNKLKVGFSEPTKMLMDLSKAVESSGMDRATAANFLSPLIGDQATLNAVLQGSKALENQIGKMKRINIVEKDSIDRAQKLREQWNELSKRGENLGNQLYAKLQPFIEKTLTWFEKLSDWCADNKDVVAGTITAIGVAIGASLVPALAKLVASPIVATGIAIAGLAASIGLLYDDYKTWKKGGDSFIHWEKWRGEFDAAGNLIDNLSVKIKEHGGIWSWLGDSITPVRDILKDIMQWIEKAIDKFGDLINTVTNGKTSGIGGFVAKKIASIGNRIAEDFNMGKDAAKAFVGDTEAKKRTGIQAYGGLGEDRGNGAAPIIGKAAKNWQESKPYIVSAGKETGVDPGVLAKIAHVESRFNSKADAGKISSAHGLGQFLDKTWDSTVKKHGGKYGLDTTDPKKYRDDPRAQALMLAEFTKDNIKRAKEIGGGSDDTANAYLMHNLGEGGGARFLKALKKNPEAPLRDALTSIEIKNNPALYKNGNMTVSQAYNNVVKQMNTGSHYATDARNYYRTENNASNQIVKNENNTIDKKSIVMASDKGQAITKAPSPISKNNIDANKPTITKVIESAKPQPNAPKWDKQDNNALVFAANNPNYRQSSRPQPVQSTSSVRTNEVNIQNVNVTTSKETAPGIWKDMKAAIKDNPLMQYNEAMS